MAQATCDMCSTDATHDVVTIRTTMQLCEACLDGQEHAGVVEGVHDVGVLFGGSGGSETDNSDDSDDNDSEGSDDGSTWDQIQSFGDISDEEVIVEYEKTSGGQKTVGGEVSSAYESYDNRTNVRKVTIDFESHGGNWRITAEKGTHTTEVTLHSLEYEYDDFEKVGVKNKTRISERDGITSVTTAEDW